MSPERSRSFLQGSWFRGSETSLCRCCQFKQQIIAAAERAPFGRGPETVFDANVRRVWQIEPSSVKIASKHWPQTIQSILGRVAEGLGAEGPIEAELYKLLVYDEGSFFVGHRDTEKSSGMFATLVIVLPSVCSGGELVVRHAGARQRSISASATPRKLPSQHSTQIARTRSCR
jgi:hypothetical protein